MRTTELEAPPRLLVIEPVDADERDECWFEVVEIGLPAVRNDGTMLAVVEHDGNSGAEGHIGGSDFVTHDLDNVEGSDRRRLADDAWDRAGTADDGPLDRRACRRYEQRLRERVAAFNAELADYRPLEQLDVVVHDPDLFGDQDPANVPAPARPVQAMYREGWFTLRVPGLAVLATQAHAAWQVDDALCDATPHIDDIYGDRTARVGVVAVNHAGDTGECDGEAQSFHPVALPAAVFDELDRRPSDRYWSLVDASARRS
jgi:hypothetical protein